MAAAPDPIAHMLAHRSIRRYRPDPVPDDVLHRVLEAGVRASSSGNMQAYSIVVTRDRALRERLHAPHMAQDMVLEAPVLVTFCADFHRMRRWLALSDAEDGFDDFFAFMVAAIDAVLVSQNVALAAEAEGLGICYLGSTLANCDEIGRLLELPRGVVPVTGFVMGTPAEDPPRRDRLPLDGLVHVETYQQPDDDAIRATYRRGQPGADLHHREVHARRPRALLGERAGVPAGAGVPGRDLSRRPRTARFEPGSQASASHHQRSHPHIGHVLEHHCIMMLRCSHADHHRPSP